MAVGRIVVTAPYSHPRSDKLVGKRVWYRYESGYIFEQHYRSKDKIVWKAVGGELDGYSQEETYHCFEIAENIFFITWCEEQTPYSIEENVQREGPWPVAVVADFNKLIATVSFVNPAADGGADYIVDQARLEIKE